MKLPLTIGATVGIGLAVGLCLIGDRSTRGDGPQAAGAPTGARQEPTVPHDPGAPDPPSLRSPAEPTSTDALLSEPDDADETRAPGPDETLRIWGRVADPSGDPIEGAVLHIGTVRAATSNEEGVFSDAIAYPAIDGVWMRWHVDVQVRADGFQPYFSAAQLTAGGSLGVGAVVLDRGATVAGLVLDSFGAPVAAAEVFWIPGATDEERSRLEIADFADSDAAGAFRMTGVPPGLGCAMVFADGFDDAESPVFDVALGDSIETTIRLTVSDAARNRDRLTGRVVDPDGEAASGAKVTIDHEPGPADGSDPVQGFGGFGWESPPYILCDTNGVFETSVPAGVPIELRAFDVDGEWYPSDPLELERVDGPVELVLTDARWFDVELQDAEGSPIPWGHVQASSCPSTTLSPLTELGEAGRARVIRPRNDFHLRAFAPGYRTGDFGPFDPDDLPEKLVLALHPGQAAVGRVLFQGEPVEGARVGIESTTDPSRVRWTTGVTSLEHPFAIFASANSDDPDATTAADGRFVITLHNEGWHGVTVTAPGFPTHRFGPFEWSRHDGVRGLVLELERAGTLTGRVMFPPGMDSAFSFVGACDGWNRARTTIVDLDGNYRIEDLQPGALSAAPVPSSRALGPAPAQRVERRARGARVGLRRAVRRDDRLRPGSQRRGERRVRRCSSRLTAAAYPERSAFLMPLDNLGEGTGRPIASADVGPDGRFELSLSTGGRYELLIRLLSLDGALRVGPTTIRRVVRVAQGFNQWAADFELVRLEAEVSADRAREAFRVSCTSADGTTFTAQLHVRAPEDDLIVLDVPAGRIRIDANAGEGWELVRELYVPPGETTRVRF